MAPRQYTVLENNPVTVNKLARTLGLAPSLSFYDVYSLHDQDLLSLVPRPVYALLTIIPFSPTWHATRLAEDADTPPYTQSGLDETIPWFKQIMRDGCGSIGLLHCVAGSPARDHVVEGSALDKLLHEAIPLKMDDRGELLNSSDALFEAHQAAAQMGDTAAPAPGSGIGHDQHFVAFVKGKDGHLWELEGVRKGPLDRGLLAEDEDALSPRAIELGLGKIIEAERAAGGGNPRFSCIALAPSEA